MEDDKKKYNPMENVLIKINSKWIALSEIEKRRNNKIMLQVPDTIIKLMKQKDQLFDGLYKRNFYGGSYYDKLKVGKPNEYDLDVVLNLPVVSKPCVKCTDMPGFVQVEIQELFALLKRPEAERKKFEKIDTAFLLAEKYLSTKKVSSWFESVIDSALKEMSMEGTKTYVDVFLDEEKPDKYIRIYVKVAKGGPAFTINLSGKDIDGSDILLDIDLVPCFQFTDDKWPAKSNGYRPNTSTLRNIFLVVPKSPTGDETKKLTNLEIYWRLSFQEQERDLIKKNLKNFKPALRLLKKLRDKHNHKIASYFIKTIFLWTLHEVPTTFWSLSLSVVFMNMLRKYADRVRDKKIPYYWNSKFNLIGNLKDSTKTDVANTLGNIIADIERNLSEPLINPFTIGKYLLLPEELEEVKKEVLLGKKVERSISAASTSSILNSPAVDTTDSNSDTIPPLEKILKFEPGTANSLWQYSDLVEEKTRRNSESIMAQISNRSNGFSNNEVLIVLKKIDEKMDTMLERFDKSEENIREITSKLASLENQVKQLQAENKALNSKINESESKDVNIINPVDAILKNRQINNNTSLMN